MKFLGVNQSFFSKGKMVEVTYMSSFFELPVISKIVVGSVIMQKQVNALVL